MTPGKIFQQIPKIMAEVGAVGKSEYNQGQKYQFRGIDNVYNALQHVLSKHSVFTVPCVLTERSEERAGRSGGVLIYRILTIEYKFYADDGSSITAVVVGEAMDSGDKAANKAMSVAHKYALLQVFSIATEEHKDPERDNPDPQFKGKIIANVYLGTEDQKKEVFNALTASGITDPKDMVQFVNGFKGCAMAILKSDIEDFKVFLRSRNEQASRVENGPKQSSADL